MSLWTHQSSSHPPLLPGPPSSRVKGLDVLLSVGYMCLPPSRCCLPSSSNFLGPLYLVDRGLHVFLYVGAHGLLSALPVLSIPSLWCSLLTSRAMRPGGGSGRGGRGRGRKDRSSGMRSGGSRPRTTSRGRGRGSGSGKGMARASGRLGPMTAGPVGAPPAPTATAALASSSPAAAAATTASSFSFRPNPRPRPNSRGVAGSSCGQGEEMKGSDQGSDLTPIPILYNKTKAWDQRAGKRYQDRERSL